MNTSLHLFPVPDRWCLHSYYTLCPYAPDGSGRILIAGSNLENNQAEILVLSPEGEVMHRFPGSQTDDSFYHTGLWQTWSPDSQSVYFQAGSLKSPKIGRYDLYQGTKHSIDGDMEGAPPTGDPILSGLLGMLYAAGYGDGLFKPESAPVPFQARDQHGIFEFSFEPPSQKLRLSVREILEKFPLREKLLQSDAEIKGRLGTEDGLTLMAYCVRWCPDGSKFLFFFGNHNVVRSRGEPRLSYVLVSDRSFKPLDIAMDMSYGRRGVHWSWQPDNEHLIGYGPHPEDPGRNCLAEVRYDGSGYRLLSEHASGGHPSISPTDPDLIVTDEGTPEGGAVVFISKKTGQEIHRVALPKFSGEKESPGRNPLRICHHPVFNRSGDRVLCNSLPGKNAELVEIRL